MIASAGTCIRAVSPMTRWTSLNMSGVNAASSIGISLIMLASMVWPRSIKTAAATTWVTPGVGEEAGGLALPAPSVSMNPIITKMARTIPAKRTRRAEGRLIG
jgi:hypothetical protein